MKILISGGDGGLAKEIVKQNTEHDIAAPNRRQMDISRNIDIVSNLTMHKPDIFIHAAAMTRPMVEHIKYPGRSIASNIIGTANVVCSCMSYNKTYNKNIKIIYISTDYVYPGTTGNYKEEDPLLPINEYAWTKLGGECSVKLYQNHLILRACITQSPFPHKKAFIDSYKSCMYHKDAAKIILKLINKNLNGTINLGGNRLSVYDFASKEYNVEKLKMKDIKEEVAKDSSMDISKLLRVLND